MVEAVVGEKRTTVGDRYDGSTIMFFILKLSSSRIYVLSLMSVAFEWQHSICVFISLHEAQRLTIFQRRIDTKFEAWARNTKNLLPFISTKHKSF